MHTPRFWRKASRPTETPAGRTWQLEAWGWSDESEEAAAEVARERLRGLAEAVAAGKPLERYSYQHGARPLREQVLDRSCPGSVTTRNGYGARVLNTERVAFVDVDFPPQPPPPGFLSRLFGARAGPDRQQQIDVQLELLRAALRPERISARVYETHAGLRLLLTDRCHDPSHAPTLELLQGLGCDPLYQRLCQQQACFRARLTPKPWRCGLPAPPSRWPYLDAASEEAARAWVARYESACEAFATTRFVTTLGGRDVHDDVHPILELHDQLTGATSERPLA